MFEISLPYISLLFLVWAPPFYLDQMRIAAFINSFVFTFVYLLYLLTGGIEISLFQVYLVLLFYFAILLFIGVGSVMKINTVPK